MSTNKTSRNARIATALFLAAVAFAATIPSAAAEGGGEEDHENDGPSCVGFDVGVFPPSVVLDPQSCIPPSP